MSYDVVAFKQVCLEARVKFKKIRYGMAAAGIPDVVVVGVAGIEIEVLAREFTFAKVMHALASFVAERDHVRERTRLRQLRADLRRAAGWGCAGYCAVPTAVVLGVVLDAFARRRKYVS